VELPDLRPGDLIACSEPPGPSWLSLIERAWEAQAAVLPLEPRLPARARDALLARCRPSVVDGVRIHDDEVVGPRIGLVIATSGTTGEPKAVLLSRDALRAAVERSAKRLGLDGEPWGCPIPVAHIGGMLVVLRGLLLGAPVDFTSDPASSRAPWSSIVPLQLARLARAGVRLEGRAFLVGGDRLDADLRARAEELGARILHTYGMSETCGGVVYDGVPLDDVIITLGDDARITIDGPTLFDGYVGADARVGAFATADRGCWAANGTLEIRGRIDDIVIINGENLDRGAIEATIRQIPGVDAATVRVLHDPDRGASLVARIDAPRLTDAQLAQIVRDTHGALAVPRIERDA